MNRKVSLILLIVCGFVYQLNAQILTGHYSPGLFGLRSAHGFPMDWSYVNVTQFYYAAELKDNDGNISTLAKPVNVIANVSAGIWGKRWEKLGANYNAALVVPVTNLAPNPETLELDPDKVGVGDIMIIPLMLSWNEDWIAINTRYALWIPIGSFGVGSNKNRGKGFWSHNLGLGVTLYLDKARSWSFSSMETLEFNSSQKTSRIKPGSSLVTEWGFGKTFNKAFNLGLIGSMINQIGKQDGGNLPAAIKNYRVSAMGMELGYRTTTKWVFTTRWYLDYRAINRPEAIAIRFILLKNF